MKNTKFRKRALLSSVAMLLVALVALGSATFAWFAESPNVDARGLKINTTASDGLQILAEVENSWGTTAHLNNNSSDAFNLLPASQVQNSGTTYHGDVFYTMKAAAPGNYASGTNTIEGSSAGHNNQPVYAEKIYFRLTQTSSSSASRDVVLTGVTITQDENNDNDLANAIRVSICDADNKVLGTYALATAGANGTIPYDQVGKKIGATAAADTVVPVAYSPALATSVGSTPVPMVSNVTKNSATSGTDVKYVTVYVWLDGQDGNCYTNNVDPVDVAAIISGIQLDFSLTAQS